VLFRCVGMETKTKKMKGEGIMVKVVSVLVLCLAVAVVAGCRKKSQEQAMNKAIEKAIEKQSGGKAKVDLSKGQMTFKDKEGQVTVSQGGGAQLPDGFPKDVLIHKGAAITIASKQPNVFSVVLTSKDDKSKIVDAYKSSLKSQGWEEASSMDMGDVTTFEYKKEKENRTLVVNVTKESDKTQITLIVETRKE